MRTISEISLQRVRPEIFGDADLSQSMVWEADLTLRRGSIYMVEAESGAGKSSMCSFIYGNRSDYRGRILYDGSDIRQFSQGEWTQLRRRHIALLPQELRLFPELTALENIEIKNQLTGHKSPQQIMAMLDELEIADKCDAPVAKMSIGQQQRVAIIRALCQPFDFLLLDEPVSHLDERNNRIAAAMILREAQEQGAGVVATSVGNPLIIELPITRLQL